MLTHHRNDVEDNDSSRTPDTIDIVVGGNVRRVRLMRHLSQEELAQRVGLSFQQIQKYEKGTNRIGASRIVKLARALEVRPGTLFEGTGADNAREIADAFTSLVTQKDVQMVNAYKAIACPKQKAALFRMACSMAQAED